MTPAEVIREGRNVLFERGWHQGGPKGLDGRVCSVAALAIASKVGLSERDALAAWSKACRYIHEVIGHHFIFEWNDDPNRTFGEVVDAFDKAEKLAERDEVAS